MNYQQKRIVDRLAVLLANLIHGNNFEVAQKLSPIVEALLDRQFVYAILLMETAGFSTEYIRRMRKIFRVKDFK